MLEIIIIFIIVVASFAFIAWYAMRSTRQARQTKIDQNEQRAEPDLGQANVFGAVLKQEMTQNNNISDLDAEPHISLSTHRKQDNESNKNINKQQKEIDFKENDEIDLAIDIVDEAEPSIEIVNDWDMVIAFTIMAEEGHNLSGPDLKVALENEQFHYGEMQIFHRLTPQKKVLFSVANILDPGTFSIEDINNLITPGILVFAKLPGPINGLALFDEILETSRTLAASLSAVLCDDSRKPVTDEIIESMRSRILSLNFSIHSETRATHVYTD